MMTRIQDRNAVAPSTAEMRTFERDAGRTSSNSTASHKDGCVGAIERVEKGKVFGWVYSGDQATVPPEIRLLDGSEKIAVFVPNIARCDIADAGFGRESFGFAVKLPAHLFDGALHSLRLCRQADGKTIAGSQKQLRLRPELAVPDGEQIEGRFLGVRGILAEGWAYDPGNPNEPVTIEILDADRVIAKGVANAFREEPDAHLNGCAFTGFRIRIPDQYLDGRQLDLSARDTQTSVCLTNGQTTSARRAEYPGCSATIIDIEDQSLVGQIKLDTVEPGQDLELELWIDSIWADRFTVPLHGDDGDTLPLRLPIPDKVRDGEAWTSIFDGDLHEFVLTAADTSLLMAARELTTTLKTYTYGVLKPDQVTELERLPRFVRQLVARLTASALFDTAFYASRVREEFLSDTDAILHYLSDRKYWRHPTSPWLDVGFIKRLTGELTTDTTSPLEWYLRQGAESDVGPNPLFSNADFCIFAELGTNARPTGASFFDDWLEAAAESTPAPNPSALIDLDYVRTTALAKPKRDGKLVLGHLASWLQQDPKTRTVDTLSPYFDQDWLEQCFILKHDKPKGCLLSAFRLGQLPDQSPHPVLQCAQGGQDYYRLIREYELLHFTGGIDDLSRICKNINADAFYAQFPQQTRHTDKGKPKHSSLYRYLTTDITVGRKSFIRELDDEFIRNEYPGLIEYCTKHRRIADVNRLWSRWIRLLGVPGNYRDSVKENGGLLNIQNIQELRYHRSQLQNASIRASFIIPTYGRDDLVIRCILSALQSGDASQIEFIVAEDAPHVDAGWILGYFLPFASVYKNSENLGFLLSCKEAVARSSGKVIMLVNNDVIVHKDAIGEMLGTFESREDAAVVGGLVLNVDGSIQENGGVLWRDASAWNYHRNWKKENEFALNIRPADYVSGCWIGIRRDAWDEIGGFDTRYVPAYYEETDFCLSCWRHNYKVYVNPLSEVTHLDGATMGQDEDNSSTLKSFQKANRRKLQEKWSPLLSTMFNENSDLTLFHSGRNDPKRFLSLIFDHYIPEPDRDAGSRTMWVVCQAMAAMNGNYVLFIPANNNRNKYAADLERLGIEVITGVEGWKRFDYLLEKHAHMIKHAFVSRIEVAKKFQWHLKKITCGKSIYIHDIDTLRGFQHVTDAPGHDELVNEAVLRYSEKNKDVFAMFHNIISLSEDETRLLKPYFGRKLVDIFPYDFKPLADGGSASERKDVLFVGSYNHRPNREAIAKFVEKIWPNVREKLPTARLHLCGSGFEHASALDGPNVILHGMVTDQTLAYLYSISRVSIAPLLSGAGMKGKVIESCSRGVPCVGTDVAWQGIQLPENFSVLTGTIATFGKRLIQAYHSYDENTAAELIGLYDSWREINKIADVIPRLVRSQAFSGGFL